MLETNTCNRPVWRDRFAGRNVCIETYGCAYNEGDSSFLVEIIRNEGGVIVSTAEEADLVILNTCIVIDKTERNMIRRIRALIDKEIWITGCLPFGRPELLDSFPLVRVFHSDEILDAWKEVGTVSPSPVGVVQIGPGCVGCCSYCVTRVARGRIRSRNVQEIADHVRMLADSGAVEIRLTGQDLSAFGLDRGYAELPHLLHVISEIPGSFRVRLGMMNPATLAPIVRDVGTMLLHERFFRFVHIPVQSGSDKILGMMKRGYTVCEMYDIVDTLRGYAPDLSLAIDLICGYPQESEEDHHENMRVLKELNPDLIHVTRYSYRPGSGCDRTGELPDRIRKDRSRELIAVGYAQLKKKREGMIGRREQIILTENLREGSVMGRTPAYQGVVIHSNILPGTSCNIRITEARTHYLIGEPL